VPGPEYSPNRIAAGFDAGAATYDAAREKLVPGFRQLYTAAVRLLPFEPRHAIRVLDLGAGTGLLSAWILLAYPRARMTLVDIAPEMLERARERLRGSSTQPVIHVLDYSQTLPPGEFDAVVSALSIHHLDDARKQRLFHQIRDALAPQGTFINLDQVAGPTPTVDARYHAAWLEDVRQAGATEQEIQRALERMAHDRCSPLAAQLKWLEDAGFQNADCWMKIGRFAVYSGTKPAY
jgi:tRNA (cmo5U34)-methyltransferase